MAFILLFSIVFVITVTIVAVLVYSKDFCILSFKCRIACEYSCGSIYLDAVVSL